MFILSMDVNPLYVMVPDWKASVADRKHNMLLNVQYTITALRTETADLDDLTATQVLADLYIKQSDSEYTRKFTPPDLAVARTGPKYRAGPYRAGSDYIELPTGIHDWRLVKVARLNERPETGDVRTLYVVSGRWDHYQGMFHNLQRRA